MDQAKAHVNKDDQHEAVNNHLGQGVKRSNKTAYGIRGGNYG